MLLCACGKDEDASRKPATAKQIDSMVEEQAADIRKEAAEDLDMRRAIDVRQKADSIVAARMKKADSAK